MDPEVLKTDTQPEPVADSSADSQIWDDLANDAEEYGDLPEAEPEVAAAEVGGEAEPQAEPKVEPVVEPTPPSQVQPQVSTQPEVVQSAPVPQLGQPSQPTAPVEQPSITPPYQFTPTPEQIEAFRTQVLNGLAEMYKVSPEDATALQLEPEKVLPKLAANVHAQIYSQVMTEINQRAPALIEQVLTQRTQSQRAEEAFYGRWPQLRGHDNEVTRAAMIYRQMSPQTDLQTAIEATGRMVHAALGIPYEGGQAAAVPPPPPPPPPPAGPTARAAAPPRSNLSPSAQAFVQLANEWDDAEEI